ncbi:MAG TPA: hypothetical protein VFK90_09000 [Anaeromyxobacter sp.]|nr:hypothetical protein [Anaeromyxobacter sp.]
MAHIPNVVALPSQPRRERWLALRDFLGGALLLAAWLALWTATWAAVAGPLRPAEPARTEVAAVTIP